MKKVFLVGMLAFFLIVPIYANEADGGASLDVEPSPGILLELDEHILHQPPAPVIEEPAPIEEPALVEEPAQKASEIVKAVPIEHHVPAITEPSVSKIPYTKTPPIIPYSWNMLTLEGNVNPADPNTPNSFFFMNIETGPIDIEFRGSFVLDYYQDLQRSDDHLFLNLTNEYQFDDTGIRTSFTFDILYKNWLFDIQDKVPFFIQGGIDPNIFTATPPALPTKTENETLEFSWANSTFNTVASVQPVIGVGVGRMYNINHLISARIILRSLGLDSSDETIHKAASILAKENQFMNSITADFSQNYRKYYRALLEALGMAGRHIDLLSLEGSQVYAFDQDKFAFSRFWFSPNDMNLGWEVSLSAAPMILYSAPASVVYPEFTLTLQEEYSHITIQDRLYVKLEASQTLLQYNTLWLQVMLGAELRYYPKYNRMWFALGFEDTVKFDVNNNTPYNSQLLDLSAHYLITPNFMIQGRLDINNFKLYTLNIGGKIRIL